MELLSRFILAATNSSRRIVSDDESIKNTEDLEMYLQEEEQLRRAAVVKVREGQYICF